MDFTIQIYTQFLKSLQAGGYCFQTVEQYLNTPKERTIMLRHDVDLLPLNSLGFAEIQSDLGIVGTYYFRAVPESWNEEVITYIASLGHEIGYHYECLTTCNGDMEKGIVDFEENLNALRKLAPVKTICMHGSPMSKYDSKDLWKQYRYQAYDIIGEPYFDINFDEVFYITDTGRKWDGHAASVRDKVQTSFTQRYHTTKEIIDAIAAGDFPSRVMFTFHPQRWSDNFIKWGKELVVQNVKNVIKKHFYVNR
ncbi:hypothetical protein ACFSTE_08825 [Aquimarina hainanensis]|uniref:Polysaccharide deacetylase n=1 Tax=Aquimarina hainanensis TaxID=1578017 RepID=A0ABW5N723_9FLAO